ncbi:hypothetical protein H2198_003675 [Neophaeococcomyces mojaviensis]|uniref:Uncharacterized protein n=1 Tax=Neophaeococcomyces mojaviensis TaxID=3383035 RepID=A0ACC3AAW1_9EURO|nr:hypothetical protein H2198_003675 [Knufia sp. JES_112]
MFGVIGTPVNQINREYTLTQIGIDVIRPLLLRQLGGGREMNLNELTGRRKAYAEVLLDAMNPVLDHVQQVYGGIDGYFSTELCSPNNDVDRIRANLTDNTSDISL